MLEIPSSVELHPLLKPFKIGHLTIDPPLTLAPMAGQTNRAFRDLCRHIGACGLVCTELISSRAMQHNSTRQRTFRMFDWDEDEKPFAVQLFGNDPGIMAEAARIVVDNGANIVDINMGCWVPKVAGKGAGAALLKDLDTATAVVEAVVSAVDVPVTVKVRAGWEPGEPTAIAFARAAEQVGVQAVAVHARYARQGFTGEPDWDIIRRVKEVVSSIPVIGNGDVLNAADAVRMVEQTGCDAVMIGRGALGNPWLFKQIMHEICTGTSLPPPALSERAEVMLWHARRALETSRKPQRTVLHELRGQLIKYVYGQPFAARIREKIFQAESLADIEVAVQPLYESVL